MTAVLDSARTSSLNNQEYVSVRTFTKMIIIQIRYLPSFDAISGYIATNLDLKNVAFFEGGLPPFLFQSSIRSHPFCVLATNACAVVIHLLRWSAELHQPEHPQ